MQNNIVYILFSKKLNRYYIGYTSDMDVRMSFHQNAESHKYTAKADDWNLIFQVNCQSKTQALAIEKHTKAMKSKVYIQNLIAYPEMTEKLLAKYTSEG